MSLQKLFGLVVGTPDSEEMKSECIFSVLHPAAPQSDGQLTPAERRVGVLPNEVLGLRAPDDEGPDKQLHVILPVTRLRIVSGRSMQDVVRSR